MRKSFKIWIWAVLVFDGLTVLVSLMGLQAEPAHNLFGLFLEAIQIAGFIILLTRRRRLGFYLVVLSEIMIFIANIALLGVDPFLSLINSAPIPLGTYLMMRPEWAFYE